MSKKERILTPFSRSLTYDEPESSDPDRSDIMANVVSPIKQDKNRVKQSNPSRLVYLQSVVSGVCATISVLVAMSAIGFVCAQTASTCGIDLKMDTEKLRFLIFALLACFAPPLVHAALQSRILRVIAITSIVSLIAGAAAFTFIQCN